MTERSTHGWLRLFSLLLINPKVASIAPHPDDDDNEQTVTHAIITAIWTGIVSGLLVVGAIASCLAIKMCYVGWYCVDNEEPATLPPTEGREQAAANPIYTGPRTR
jgi:hypothetical protein